MAICEHTPPRPPLGGVIDDLVWTAEVCHRRNLVGLLCAHGAYNAPQVSTSVWLPPDDAEKVGSALLAAVAAWRAHNEHQLHSAGRDPCIRGRHESPPPHRCHASARPRRPSSRSMAGKTST